MSATMQTLITNTCDLPAVPDVANRVMQLLADPDSTPEMLCKTIAADQSLTARILKIANSPFYGCLRTINNLRAAIVIMGYSAVRSLVIAVSTREVYKTFGLTERMLWEHSVGVGIGSHLVAKEVRLSKLDDVFVCGLMHDLGKVVMNNTDPDRYREVMEAMYNDGGESLAVEEGVFGFSHPEVGALVVRKWNLPEELEQAVRFHHHIDQLSGHDRYLHLLASILNLADTICQRLGIGSRGVDNSIAVHDSPAANHLGLSGEGLDRLMGAVEKAYNEERSNFG